MGIEEGEEVQAKAMCTIFKIVTENFPNLEIQEASRTPNRHDQNRTPQDILSLKQQIQRLEKEY
jgi:hypothetical protein